MRHALARDTVAARVAGFPRVAVARPDLKQAAVAVCVTEVAGTLSLLLTRRAAALLFVQRQGDLVPRPRHGAAHAGARGDRRRRMTAPARHADFILAVMVAAGLDETSGEWSIEVDRSLSDV